MIFVNRRSTLSLGSVGLVASATIPFLGLSMPARAEIPAYGPNDGAEMSPGVRWVDIGEVESQIAAYKMIKYGDAIYQPDAIDPADQPLMDMDMFCYILQSDFEIHKAGIPAYSVMAGGCYTCGIGKSDQARNIGSGLGIMRVAMFVPA